MARKLLDYAGLGRLIAGLKGEYSASAGLDNYITVDVDGDADTYYPVMISQKSAALFPSMLLSVSRDYAAKAPSSWNNATHKGALTLCILWNNSKFWDGNGAGNRAVTHIIELYQQYSTMLGGIATSTRGLIVWLRGGGARYWIHSGSGTGLSATVHLEPYTDSANQVFAPRTEPVGVSDYQTLNVHANSANTATRAAYADALRDPDYHDIAHRRASANINFDNDAGLHKFLATSAMVSGRPMADGHILHSEWDNSLSWAAQLFLPTQNTQSMQWRYQVGTEWQPWRTLLDSTNYAATLDGRYARLASANNLVHSSNEFTIIPDGYNAVLWINYGATGNGTGNIGCYNLGDGSRGGYAPVMAKEFRKAGGTSTQFLMGDGSIKALSDLVQANSEAVLSRVTVQSGSDAKVILDNTDDETYWSYISFRQKGVEYGRLGTVGTTDLLWSGFKVLHAGNYSDTLDTRYLTLTDFADLFVKESDGNGGYRIRARYGLYSDHFMSANGTGAIQWDPTDDMWHFTGGIYSNSDLSVENCEVRGYFLPQTICMVDESATEFAGLIFPFGDASKNEIPGIEIAAGQLALCTLGDSTMQINALNGTFPTKWEWHAGSDTSWTDFELGGLTLHGTLYANTINVASTALVTNLNADMLDGYHASWFVRRDSLTLQHLDDINGWGFMTQAMSANAMDELGYPIGEAGLLIYGQAAYSSSAQIYGSFSTNRWFARGGGSGVSAKTAWREFAMVDYVEANYIKSVGDVTLVGGLTVMGNVTAFGAGHAFVGDLTGNAATATKLQTARMIGVRDYTLAHAGTVVSVDGSSDVLLPLPSVMDMLTVNVDTALWLNGGAMLHGRGSYGGFNLYAGYSAVQNEILRIDGENRDGTFACNILKADLSGNLAVGPVNVDPAYRLLVRGDSKIDGKLYVGDIPIEYDDAEEQIIIRGNVRITGELIY